MIVIADASPLIFLAKVRRLDLLHSLFSSEIVVPKLVCSELLPEGVDDAEGRSMGAFLGTCRVEAVRRPRRFASAMSVADNAALTLAVRRKADLFLCDDRITRMMAEAEGIRPLGTLGILLQAMRQSIISSDQTKTLLQGLVRSHHFRISIELYQAVLTEIDKAV